jgi:hypothetical protein
MSDIRQMSVSPLLMIALIDEIGVVPDTSSLIQRNKSSINRDWRTQVTPMVF